jgi:hypothetical protein
LNRRRAQIVIADDPKGELLAAPDKLECNEQATHCAFGVSPPEDWRQEQTLSALGVKLGVG